MRSRMAVSRVVVFFISLELLYRDCGYDWPYAIACAGWSLAGVTRLSCQKTAQYWTIVSLPSAVQWPEIARGFCSFVLPGQAQSLVIALACFINIFCFDDVIILMFL